MRAPSAVILAAVAAAGFAGGADGDAGRAASAGEPQAVAGRSADIAPSAYLCRAGRKPEENDPECSFLFAGKDIPSHFGPVSYEIVAAAGSGTITATVELLAGRPPREVLLRLRHPRAAPIRAVKVNGQGWKAFDAAREALDLGRAAPPVRVDVTYDEGG